jgi:hypothetical protein
MTGGAETAPPGQASLDQRLLLQDAVDRVIANPSAAEGWITLVARTREVAQRGRIEGLAALLQQRVPASGVGGFSLQCFLGWLTGDLRHREQAGQVLLDLMPFDPDRACAFMHSMWQHGLQAATHLGAFERSLQAAQLPRIADVLGRQLARQLSLPGPVGSAGAVLKVALVAPALTCLQHPPTRMALDQAWVLARAGLVVELFSCQESSSAAFRALLAGTVSMDVNPVDTAGWADHVGAPVRLHQSDPRFSVHSRLRDMLPRVLASRPDAVLCVGLITGLAQALFERLPVVGLATNSVPPMLPCDVWLSAAAQPPAAPWDLSLPPSQAWHIVAQHHTRRDHAVGADEHAFAQSGQRRHVGGGVDQPVEVQAETGLESVRQAGAGRRGGAEQVELTRLGLKVFERQHLGRDAMRAPSCEPVLQAQIARAHHLRQVDDDLRNGQSVRHGAVHQVRQDVAQAEDDQGLARRFHGLGAQRRAGFSVSASVNRGSAASFTLDVGC